METLGRLCSSLTDQAIIEASERFAAGDVKDQSKKFAPSGPEFVEEARRREELVQLRDRPRLSPPPAYRPGPMAPFEIARQKALAKYVDRPVLFEDITYDQFRRLSAEKQISTGAFWSAATGTVYGPEPKQARAA